MVVWGHRRAMDGAWSLMKAEDPLRWFEAFAGASAAPGVTAGWSDAARRAGHDVKVNEIIYPGNTQHSWTDHDFGYMPDVPGDIMQVSAEDIADVFDGQAPDVAAFSPPCEGFSIAGAVEDNWSDWDEQKKRAFNTARRRGDMAFFDDPTVGPTPTSHRSERGRMLMNQVLALIDGLQEIRQEQGDPEMAYVIENPAGMMRYQPEMGRLPMIQPRMVASKYPGPYSQPNMKRTGSQPPVPSVTHASYSGPFAAALGHDPLHITGHPELPSRKPTDLWSNLAGEWIARPHTKVGSHRKGVGHAGLFHEEGPRGAKSGTQGLGPMTLDTGIVIPAYHRRSLIPAGLGADMLAAVEAKRRGLSPYSQGRLF